MVHTYAAAPKLRIHVLDFIMCVEVYLHAHIYRQSWIQFSHERNKHKFLYKICWASNSIFTVTISLSCHLFFSRDSGFLTPAFFTHQKISLPSLCFSHVFLLIRNYPKIMKNSNYFPDRLDPSCLSAGSYSVPAYSPVLSQFSYRLPVKPGLISLSNFCSPFLNTLFTLGAVGLLPLFNKIGPPACQSIG